MMGDDWAAGQGWTGCRACPSHPNPQALASQKGGPPTPQPLPSLTSQAHCQPLAHSGVTLCGIWGSLSCAAILVSQPNSSAEQAGAGVLLDS